MERRYPRIRFQKRLDDLRKDVEDLGETSLSSYKKALDAFISYDEELVNSVMKSTDKLDEMNYRLEHRAMSIIASEQPVAKDLRFIEACKVLCPLHSGGSGVEHCPRRVWHFLDRFVRIYRSLHRVQVWIQVPSWWT